MSKIRRKDSIIDQLLLDFRKISTQHNYRPQAQVSEDYQKLASIKYNINPNKQSQKKKNRSRRST